jgi:hypothetical protein
MLGVGELMWRVVVDLESWRKSRSWGRVEHVTARQQDIYE